MKLKLTLVCLFVYTVGLGQKISFDTTILVGQEKQVYSERGIKLDNMNNKFIVGYFKGSLSIDTFTINTLNSISNNSYSNAQGVYIAKYDSNNNIKWVKKFAEADTLFYANLNIDNNNNLLISYAFLSKLYLGNDSIQTQYCNSNINIVKYSNDGIKLNSFQLPGCAGISPSGISFDGFSNIYLSGSYGIDTNPNYQFVFGNDTLNANHGDFFIAKLDSLYNVQWVKSYGGFGTDGVQQIIYFEDKLYILSGFINAGTAQNNIGGITFNYPAGYFSKLAIAKLDTNGNGIWVRRFGSNDIQSSGISATSLVVQNNRVYFTGHASTNNANVFLFDGGPTLIGNGNSTDYFIACYDTAGNFKWNKISNTFSSNYLTQLAADSNSNVYGVGIIDGVTRFPTDTLFTHGAYDAMVCSYDSVGNFRWAINGGGKGTEVGSGIALDSHGKLYIVGGTTSTACYMGNDTLYPPAGQSTLFFASLDSIQIHAPNAVPEQEKNAMALQLIPNPANTVLDIKLMGIQQEANAKLSIENALGQTVSSYLFQSSSIRINTSQFSEGIYFLRYSNAQHTITKKILIQH